MQKQAAKDAVISQVIRSSNEGWQQKNNNVDAAKYENLHNPWAPYTEVCYKLPELWSPESFAFKCPSYFMKDTLVSKE